MKPLKPGNIVAHIFYVALVAYAVLFLQQPKPLLRHHALCERGGLYHANPYQDRVSCVFPVV